MIQCKQGVMTGPGKLEIREQTLPELKAGEVLVKVSYVGICTWEQRFFKGNGGPYPFIGGHEITGTIEEVGTGVTQKLQKGDTVVVASLTRCGECYYCRRGLDNLCENGDDGETGGDGSWGPKGFSEYVVAKGYEVFPIHFDGTVEKQFDPRTGTLAEPLACVIRSIERGKIEQGDYAAVLGGGVMGLLHVILAKQSGARIILSEPDEKRRKAALDFGADYTVDPLREDVPKMIKDLTRGRGCDSVFFTAGGAAAIRQGIDSLRLNGTLVVYGGTGKDDQITIDPKLLHYNEVYLTGVTKHTKDGFRKGAELISSRELPLEKLISAEYPFDDIVEAFQTAMDSSTYRVVLAM